MIISEGSKDPTRAELALERIKAIIIEEDLAGLVLVQDQESSAFLTRIDPKWSCIRMIEHDDGGVEVRVKSKRVDYDSSESQKKHVELSLGIILTAMNWITSNGENMSGLLKMITGHFPDIEHWERKRS